MGILKQTAGRELFGENPEAYDRFRPTYPKALFETLAHYADLSPGAQIFEIGPGTGQATRELIKFKPARLDLIEPDKNLGRFIKDMLVHESLQFHQAPFEEAELSPDNYDLGAAAMSFHWVNADAGLSKIARILKPGGVWAMWWTQFGNPEQPDDFGQAAKHLFDQFPVLPHRPGSDERQLASSHQARLDVLGAQSDLVDITTHAFEWLHVLSASELRGLFSTFSPVLALETDKREHLLDQFETIVNEQFGGVRERPVTTRLYLARRPPERPDI